VQSDETTVVALVGWIFTSVRQPVTPRHVPGRMKATYRFVSYLVNAIGAVARGLVGAAFGTRTGLPFGCTGLPSTIVWVAAGSMHTLREPSAASCDPYQGGTR
jgi:hypothetical protein